MGEQLNQYFHEDEFACKCGCGFNDPDPALLYILTCAREHFNAPCRINSACRCLDHNRSCGSTSRSQHVLGNAADFTIDGVEPDKVTNWLEAEFNPGGLGRYATFTHVDVRHGRARWNG